jgi:alkylation response protein AidB-like acyl-CoA dehydrogenase
MMDFSLTKEQQELISSVKNMASKEITPFALQAGETEKKKMLKSLARMNLLCPTVPKEFGGLGLGLVSSALVVEELAAASPGLAAIVAATLHAAEPIILAGNDQQKNEFLPLLTGREAGAAAFALTEPEGGSDLNIISTYATAEQTGYLLNGCKDYVINAGIARFITVVAATDMLNKKASLRIFLIPGHAAGLKTEEIYQTSGINLAPVGRIKFVDVGIRDQYVIKSREAGSGYLLLTQTFDVGRALVSALAVGIARAALEHALHFAENRLQSGIPIKKHQAVAFTLADMATKIEMARLMTWKACWLIDQGEDYSVASAMAKLVSSTVAQQVTCAAADILGARGYLQGNLIEQLVRDARVLSTIEGTNHIQRLVISSQL